MEYLIDLLFYIYILSLTIISSSYLKEHVRGSLVIRYVRIIVFYIPFLLPFFIYGLPKIEMNFNINYILLSIGASCTGIILHKETYKPYLNKDVFFFLPYFPFSLFITTQIGLIAGVFFEEILFRVFLPEFNLLVDTIISGLIFSLFHFISPMKVSKQNLKSFFILIFLGSVWYLSYRLSGSLLPSLLGHFLYNLPSMCINFYRFIVCKKYHEQFDKNIEID